MQRYSLRGSLRGAFAVLLLVAVARAQAGVLSEKDIQIAAHSTHNRVTIRLDGGADVRVVNEIQNHDYFFIDLYSIRAGFPNKLIPIQDGVLKAIQTVAYPEQQVVRVIFYPVHKTTFRVADQPSGFIYPPTAAAATRFVSSRRRATQLVVDTPRQPHFPLPSLFGEGTTAGKRIVVIDPGHGGDDPGTTSNGKYAGRVLQEKDIVLAVGLELHRLLSRSPNVTAVLTRDRDVNMTLKERVDFAERIEDADLFVSIHVNATKYHRGSPTARGAEFFFLAENSNAENRALLEAENRADSDVLDAQASAMLTLIEKTVIKDMIEMHRGSSVMACEAISASFQQDPFYRGFNRGIKSAPFRVLMNRVMPSVLIEIGFIDNREEAVQMADPAFQRRVARLLANGIQQYFAQLDPEFAFYQYKLD